MKIVNKEEFMKLPPNTLFSYYEPHCIRELLVKGDNCGDNDFFYASLLDAVDANDTGEFVEILSAARYDSKEFKMNYNQYGRDGMFNDADIYLVYDEEDVKQLANHLLGLAKTGKTLPVK